MEEKDTPEQQRHRRTEIVKGEKQIQCEFSLQSHSRKIVFFTFITVCNVYQQTSIIHLTHTDIIYY